MAEQILLEVETNVKAQFPSAAHMCSWAEPTLYQTRMKVQVRGNQPRPKKETSI
ncbi:hypothetical protein [Heyndrickxia acidicola]|uniref:Uncharacterized protein n=1 Tax=Heyndrickxia acidicola TaxID=209389 RepID=A0ABU6MF12_9BACI|nr:hypothetical protein [Heyndrickxia acidicola]MED1203075.1 hypothetical protein [Heyndrickxia acidicola]